MQVLECCEPNHGPDDGPLFLVNHWITTDPDLFRIVDTLNGLN